MLSKFTRGFLDGSLSTLGVVIGASSGSTSIVVAAGIGGALANAVSNILSAFAADSVESYSELRQIEKAMVAKELAGTEQDLGRRRAPVWAGIQDGAATLVGGLLPVIPFLFMAAFPATITAAGIVAACTFGFGIYLGILSRRNMLLMAARTTLLAILVSIVVYILQSLIASEPA